jgi:3',5'-cyclic AMP phosphodiesterase CpdA
MTVLVHISDPHFGTEQPPVVTALKALIDRLEPAAVLLGGDVTQRARTAQFDAARDFIASLGRPVLCVPGNHDIPLYNVFARLFNPYGGYRRVLGNDLEPVFETEDVLAIGVNTTHPKRHKDGEIGPHQIARVADRLRRASPRQLRIVMAHHPVQAREASDRANLLHGRRVALPTWIDAGMDLMLGGHIHLPYVAALAKDPEGRNAWAVQAGTALSHRVRGDVPNSVNVIVRDPVLHATRCLIERWDFDAAAQAFDRVETSELILSRDAVV